MAQVDLKAVISADDQASGTLNSFSGSVGQMAAGVALGEIAVRALTAAFNEAVSLVQGSIDAFSRQEDADFRLAAAVKSAGNATDLTTKQLTDMASALQQQTTFSDEAIQSAEALLVPFDNLKSNVFPQALNAVLDLSAGMGKDLTTAATIVGRALSNPAQGFNALTRVIGVFTETEKQAIQTQIDHGNVMAAQDLILQKLNQHFGGDAASAAETYSGKLKQLKNDLNNTQEGFGKALVQGLLPFIQKLDDFVKSPAGIDFANNITASIVRFVNAVVSHKDQIFAFFTDLIKLIEAFLVVLNAVITAANAVGKAISAIANFAPSGSPSTSTSHGLTHRAGGGFVAGGQPVLVGERGAEIFTPSQSGSITPNSRLGDVGGQSVVVNFNGAISMNSELDVEQVGRILAKQMRLLQAGAA